MINTAIIHSTPTAARDHGSFTDFPNDC
jgi:hypothetical protein